MDNHLEISTISSLEKVFPESELNAESYTDATVLKGETFSFQIAFKDKEGLRNFKIETDNAKELTDCILIRRVGLSPSEFCCYKDHDDNILKDSVGLFPDPLYPITGEDWLRTFPDQWRCAWVSIRIPNEITFGIKNINFTMKDEENKVIGKTRFNIEVIDRALPDQELINTQWFHGDCVAAYYGLEIFSEEHWSRLEEQFRNCTSHGMNMLLTPIFTPPLDTKVGGERPTIQLVDVIKQNEQYKFDFSKLERWINLAFDSGFRFIEISHLATQWGAEFCPKIVAETDGIKTKIFGWETKSLSSEYFNFLDRFLPEIDDFFKRRGIKDRIYFHISDEPSIEHLEQFQKISDKLKKLLKGYKFIDALSDFDFYKTGAVPMPIPAVDHIEPFVQNGVKDLWTYYCCIQYKEVPNRFFNMPSARNRILGMLLYKYRIKGFLHWGYNFYFSQYSIKKLNPFINTDAGGGFPSGDSFLVYPGDSGPIDSLRHEVFFEGLQDLRALKLLEKIKGRDFVIHLLEDDLDEELSFKSFPKTSKWLLEKREEINMCIKKDVQRDFTNVSHE